MSKKIEGQVYKDVERALLQRAFLEKIGMSKRSVQDLLKRFKCREKIANLLSDNVITCKAVFEEMREVMEYLCQEPEPNWLSYIHEYLITGLYPQKETFISVESKNRYKKSVYIFLEILRELLKFEAVRNPISPKSDLKFLKSEELVKNEHYMEYQKLKDVADELYMYELVKISREIMPFDLYSHISGVHYISTHCGRQLAMMGKPVDLSLVSGAAITHDIGKFGCNKKEISRIPYLHYYYTDQFCKVHGLNQISHIASNHSTWDLEIENLSAEALLLIYADFRVKSKRKEGVEIVCFYTLDEAFDVILSKLDNVDDAKEKRYRKVYAKLKDFENYMVDLGVNIDLTSESYVENHRRDVNLLRSDEVIDRLKFMAIDHNIGVMNNFNKDTSFASLLELARGERDWKNLRGYLNIIREYHTYMTKNQKQMTLKFIYELLSHREGDIRREAAALMGKIILFFDEEYRKELPEGIALKIDDVNKLSIWREYLDVIISPGHNIAEQQKRWIGYALRILMKSVFESVSDSERNSFIDEILRFLKCESKDVLETFVLLEALYYLPFDRCSEEQKKVVRDFVDRAADIDELEISVAVYKITRGQRGKLPQEPDTIEIFRENLKFNTPWVLKSHNIDVLLRRGRAGEVNLLQMATHFSNLLKVCDTVTVRHKAGRALLEIAPKLSFDQRNELAVELSKGLEMGEYEYSKYIPPYLGKLASMLHPKELDEFIGELRRLIDNKNDRIASVALDTVGYIVKSYGNVAVQDKIRWRERANDLLCMLLKGLGSYKNPVNQEAFVVIGQYIFADDNISLEVKFEFFKTIYKKMATLITDKREDLLTFYNNAANLNHIYRFISDFIHCNGSMKMEKVKKYAFFPGSFDPFSLGHKEIARTIRDLGYEVYLAVDEFSWSKKTQPHIIRRNIIRMSIAYERDMYLFPEEMPINIANPQSLLRLKEVLGRDDVYLVVGSDVVQNASSYKKEPEENSVHHMNHIVFNRVTESSDHTFEIESLPHMIKGDLVMLSLPTQFEDVSSTRIRENIDGNRDISYLVDKTAQQYIYDMGIYLREPQYKSMLEVENLRIGSFRKRRASFIDEIDGINEFYSTQEMIELKKYIDGDKVKTIVIRNKKKQKSIVAMASAKEVTTAELFDEFEDLNLARNIRERARGKVLVIGNIFVKGDETEQHIYKIVLTELLAEALKDNYNYAVYRPVFEKNNNREIRDVLKRSGFEDFKGKAESSNIMVADMRNPVILIQNTETMLKAPFNKDEDIKEILEKTHIKLQNAIKSLFEGNLLLSINATIMQNKMIKLVKNENKSAMKTGKKSKEKILGENMCVPFGQTMKSVVVPNTVTKAMHLDKVFDRNLENYQIRESMYYPHIENQIRAIKAFGRPVILLDDLLHKGYRLQRLNPIFHEHEVKIKKIVAGIISANGRDLAKLGSRETESAYFLPNLQAWFSESGQYPYIGGDAVIERFHEDENRQNPVINLILPYAAPLFLKGKDKDKLYEFSMVCLENARDIMIATERIYQKTYEKKLTVARLSEVFHKVYIPDMDEKLLEDDKSPSYYIERDIEKLYRLKGLVDR